MKRVVLCCLVVMVFFLSCQNFAEKKYSNIEQANVVVEAMLNEYLEISRIYNTGNISKNENQIVLDEDGYEYFIVISDKYNSIDDLMRYTESVCTFKYAAYYYYCAFSPEERPLYKEIDRKLCRAYGDMSYLLVPDVKTCKVRYSSEKLIEFEVSPVFPLSEDNKLNFTLLNTKDGWRIDNLYEIE